MRRRPEQQPSSSRRRRPEACRGMAPQLVFAYEGRRVKALSDSTHLIESLKTVRLMVEDRLGLAADSFDLFDAYGKIEQLKDLRRTVETAGENGECLLEVREQALYTRLRTVEKENGALTSRISQLEAELFKALERAEERLRETLRTEAASSLAPRVEELAAGQAEVKLALGSFNVKEFQDFSAQTHARLQEVEAQWQTDKVALTLVVEEAVKRTQQDMDDLSGEVREKLEACSAACEGAVKGQEASTERIRSVAQEVAKDMVTQVLQDVRWQREEHLRLMRQCASAFSEGATAFEEGARRAAEGPSSFEEGGPSPRSAHKVEN